MANDAREISNYLVSSLSNEVEVRPDSRALYRGPFLIARFTPHEGDSEYRKGKMTVQGASENGEFSVRLAQMAPVIGEGEYTFVGDKYLETWVVCIEVDAMGFLSRKRLRKVTVVRLLDWEEASERLTNSKLYRERLCDFV